MLNAEEAGRLRDALGAVADALGGEGVFLACTGADGEDRPDAETEGLAVLTARRPGLPARPSAGGWRPGAETPTMAPRGRTHHE